MHNMLLKILLAMAFFIGLTQPINAAELAAAFSGYGNPERGLCVKPSVMEASECAVAACRESGGKPVECAALRTCRRSGWSLSVSLTAKDGYQWEEFHCGFRTQETALAMFKIFCREARTKTLQACRLSALADPDGKMMPLK
jgi:hypothetical protein